MSLKQVAAVRSDLQGLGGRSQKAGGGGGTGLSWRGFWVPDDPPTLGHTATGKHPTPDHTERDPQPRITWREAPLPHGSHGESPPTPDHTEREPPTLDHTERPPPPQITWRETPPEEVLLWSLLGSVHSVLLSSEGRVWWGAECEASWSTKGLHVRPRRLPPREGTRVAFLDVSCGIS